MIPFTVYKISTGEILRYGLCQDDFIQDQCMDADEGVILGHYDPNYYYIDAGHHVLKEPSPGIHYEWDAINKIWVGDLVSAKKCIKNLIENERERLNCEIIVYDGKNLDADKDAKEDIMQKIAELKALSDEEEEDANFVWRDADNITHTWETLTLYKKWLHKLLIAIARRSTYLKIYCWAHKDAVNALTTVADVESYDYTIGWGLVTVTITSELTFISSNTVVANV